LILQPIKHEVRQPPRTTKDAIVDRSTAIEAIMVDFAKRTCIEGEGCNPIRYLWTDAFAVCNYLELFRKTGKTHYREMALRLVSQVHHDLGKHRSDDDRSGWISGLDNKGGETHPTLGGLRIGKKNSERKKDELYDERMEWEQDGQYYHYLTKWMHALDLVSKSTGDPRYRRWALELAQTAYDRFTYATPANAKRMYWKMSIDLTYPLVTSMGQHDALDGYITYLQLNQNASQDSSMPETMQLDAAISDLYRMSQAINWESDDPLGIGGVLSDACFLAQLIVEERREDLSVTLYRLLSYALKGIEGFMRTDTLKYQARYRLAFREFGLSIGLHGIPKIKLLLDQHAGYFAEPIQIEEILDALEAYLPLCEYIENFWLEGENQKSSTWTEHLDINAVMLGTSLDPDGYLRI